MLGCLVVTVLALARWQGRPITPARAAGEVYNVANDYSIGANPNGVWSYGYTTSLGGSFSTLGPSSTVSCGSGSLDQWSGGVNSGGANINHNPGSAATCIGFTWPANVVSMHPGQNGAQAVIRFKAPVSGTYHVNAAFSTGDPNGNTLAYILKNSNSGSPLASGPGQGSPGTSYNNDVALAKSDTVDFVIDFNGDWSFDNTFLSATITLTDTPVLYGVAPDAEDCDNGTNGDTAQGLGDDFALFVIDTSTGAGTFVGCLNGFVQSVSAIEMDLSTGILYGTGIYRPPLDAPTFNDIVLFKISTSNGAATLIGPTGLTANDGNVTDLSVRNSDHVLFGHVKNRQLNTGQLYTINKSTGAATLVGATTVQRGNAIAFSGADTLFHIGSDSELYSLNQTTGAPTDLLTLDDTNVNSDDCDFVMGAMDFNPGTGVLFGAMGASFERGNGLNCLVTVNTSTGAVTEIGRTIPALEAIAFSSGSLPATPTPTATPTPANTPVPSTATPTRTAEPSPVLQQRTNVGGAAAAVLGAIGQQGRVPVSGTAVVPAAAAISPPNTGDGGLK